MNLGEVELCVCVVVVVQCSVTPTRKRHTTTPEYGVASVKLPHVAEWSVRRRSAKRRRLFGGVWRSEEIQSVCRWWQ